MAEESEAPRFVQKQASLDTQKWSNRKEDYQLLEVIGSGATSVVQAAHCVTNGQKVAIKRIDLEQCGATIEELQREIGLMSNCNHPNVVSYYTSFIVKDELWLVMRMMSGGSLLDIIKHITALGSKGGVLDETVIATVLKGVVQGLEYFHANGLIHRDVKAGNILVGEDGSVQVADFGVSNWLHDSQLRLGGKSSRKYPRTTFVGTPCWMAPEVMDQSVGYNEKADVWSFGITALELATGTAPYAKFPPMKVLMLTLENPPPTLETCGDLNSDDYRKNYSKSFQKMVEKCLQRDPSKRPTAAELLKHPFFKKAKDNDFLVQAIIEGGPSFASRVKRVKRVPGSSGRLHKTDDGGWVWSDDEMAETVDEQSGENVKEPVDAATLTSDPVSMATHSSSVPTVQVTGPTATSSDPATQTQLDATYQRIVQIEEKMKVLKIERDQLTAQQQQNPADFAEDHYKQSVKLLDEIQRLERDKHELEFQASRQRGSSTKLPVAATTGASHPQNVPLKMCLRKRTEQNQLKDIKFDFIPGKDSADAISNDLITAGLLEMKDMVVVAANILKLVENPSQKKIVFTFGNLPSSQLDEKKLIGYAQLHIIE